MEKYLRTPIAVGVLISLVVSSLVIALQLSGLLESGELAAYDCYIRLQPTSQQKPDPRIVLIEISENDIQSQGRWPLTDEMLSKVLKMLVSYRPRVIGLDIYRDLSVPPGAARLEKTLCTYPQIVTVMKFGNGRERGINAPPCLRNTERFGFNDIVVDPGGTVRRGLLFLDDGKTVFHSFSLRLALLYLAAQGITPQPDPLIPEYMRLKKATVRRFESNDGAYVRADARGYQYLIDYWGASLAFPSFSLSDLLRGAIEPNHIRDKIVLIGTTAEGVKDFFYTPFSQGMSAGQQASGVSVHAAMASQLLRYALDGKTPLRVMPRSRSWFWVLVWGLAGAMLGLSVRSPLKLSATGFSGLILLAILVYILFMSSYWAPFLPPAISWTFSAMLVTAYLSNKEKRERASLMQLFSKHVSKEVAEVIWQQRDHFLTNGRPRPQKLMATTMFTDFKGFTSVAEKMTPQELMDWLNMYLETMARIVMKFGGVIDTYTGDGLKADFGVPVPRGSEEQIRQDAVNAVNCAIEMDTELRRINGDCVMKGLPTASMRIGISTGEVVAGTLGSVERLKYTTIGDTVNIASRLESFGKEVTAPEMGDGVCRIVVSESTRRHLNNSFTLAKLGEVSLKGKAQRVSVYCVLGCEKQTLQRNG